MFGIGGVLKGEGACKVCLNMLIQVFKLESCMLCFFLSCHPQVCYAWFETLHTKMFWKS